MCKSMQQHLCLVFGQNGHAWHRGLSHVAVRFYFVPGTVAPLCHLYKIIYFGENGTISLECDNTFYIHLHAVILMSLFFRHVHPKSITAFMLLFM